MSKTVLYWDKIEVSEEDADLLDRDMLLFGNGYVETFETGPARRIDPRHVEVISEIDFKAVEEDE